MARLIVAKGKDKGKEVEIHGTFIIGREGAADLKIADTQASRKHLEITEFNGRFQLRDLGSSNGTSVNGATAEKPTRLADGDTVKLGDVELLVVLLRD